MSFTEKEMLQRILDTLERIERALQKSDLVIDGVADCNANDLIVEYDQVMNNK